MSDQYSNKLTDDIVKYGFGVIMVPQTNYLPSFAYTVGLWESYKHPELISLGLPIDILHTMLNTVVFEVIKKKLIEIGRNYHDILEKYPVQFLTVDKRNIPDYFGQAISYYQTVDFPALQLIWPDDKGIFPYESDFREDKLCPVFTTSAWLENQQPIVEVIHDKEGHWFFLPSGEPDWKLVSLEELIKVDPTLNDVFDLDYGECANREFVGGRWKRDIYKE